MSQNSADASATAAAPTSAASSAAAALDLSTLGALLTSTDALVAAPDDASKKRLARAKMLRNVLSAKQPDITVDNVVTATSEFLNGMMEATFPLESELVDAGCADTAQLRALLDLLDGGAAWVGDVVALARAAGRLPEAAAASPAVAPATESSASSSSAGVAAGSADAAALFAEACASGAPLEEVVPAAGAEVELLGADLWEALCWRRGALRYYVVASRVKQAGEAADPDDAAAVAAAGAAAAPHAAEAEAAVGALLALLRARCEGDGGGGNRLLRYGIFSTTHLLALAYVGELAYWRWAAGGGAADGGPAHADALKYVHRYQHVVDVLMAGCEWSTARSVELLRHLGGVAKLRPVLARELPAAEADAELERLRERAGS